MEGAAGYEVWQATSSTGTYTKLGATTGTVYTGTGLSTGTTYYYKVNAYCTASTAVTYGAQSTYVSAKPIPSAPVSPATIMARYNSITVSWNAVEGASGYKVYRATSADGTYSLVKTTTVTSYTNTYLSTGRTYYYKVRAYRYYTNSYLEPNRTYHYKVVAYRTVGSARIYSAVCAPVSAAPYLGPVTNAKAARYSTTKIKLTWSAVSGRTGYEIYRATSPDGEFLSLGTMAYTYYYNGSLTTGVTYYYKIRAYRTVSGVKYYSQSIEDAAVVSAMP